MIFPKDAIVRLFKRTQNLRFPGVVHESLGDDSFENKKVITPNGPLYHFRDVNRHRTEFYSKLSMGGLNESIEHRKLYCYYLDYLLRANKNKAYFCDILERYPLKKSDKKYLGTILADLKKNNIALYDFLLSKLE